MFAHGLSFILFYFDSNNRILHLEAIYFLFANEVGKQRVVNLNKIHFFPETGRYESY